MRDIRCPGQLDFILCNQANKQACWEPVFVCRWAPLGFLKAAEQYCVGENSSALLAFTPTKMRSLDVSSTL